MRLAVLRGPAFVVLGVFVGASVGAVVQPAVGDRYRAEAVVAIPSSPASGPGFRESPWQTFAAAVRLPVVLGAAKQDIASPDGVTTLAKRVSVVGDPRSSLVRVRARGVSQAQADRLADADARFAGEAATKAAAQSQVPASANISFDFESSREGWGATRSIFNLPPRSVRLQRGAARSGQQSLRAECPQSESGCGPTVALDAAFNVGAVYTATAYVRTLGGRFSRLRLVLGANPADVATSRAVVVSRRWRRLEVRWTPQTAGFRAELGVQTVGAGATFGVDAVDLFDSSSPSGRSSRQRDTAANPVSRPVLADRYAILSPAQAVNALDLSTARATLLGAGFGLTVALGSLLAAHLARRRHREP